MTVHLFVTFSLKTVFDLSCPLFYNVSDRLKTFIPIVRAFTEQIKVCIIL